jgi:hypothetical protein
MASERGARGGSTPIFRSLRLRVTAPVVAVLIAPTLFVLAWLALEQRVPDRVLRNAEFSAGEVASAIDALGSVPADDPRVQERAEAVAKAHWLRLRILDEEGNVAGDFDYDRGTDLSQRIGDLLFGVVEVEALDSFDASLGPIESRPEFQAAQGDGAASRCQFTRDSSLLVCHAAHRIQNGMVYTQDSSRRPIAHRRRRLFISCPLDVRS